MSDSDDLQSLYMAIGYVVIKWSFIEAALDFCVSTIYVDCGGSKLRKRMPKFLKEKCNFLVEASTKLPLLDPYKKQVLNVTGRIIQIKDLRENFAHSVLTRDAPEDGVYSFARLDAKEHNHDLCTWKFDVRAFPAMADKLELLASDAQALAKLLEATVHKPT